MHRHIAKALESEGALFILGGFTLFIVEGKSLLVDGNVEGVVVVEHL